MGHFTAEKHMQVHAHVTPIISIIVTVTKSLTYCHVPEAHKTPRWGSWPNSKLLFDFK